MSVMLFLHLFSSFVFFCFFYFLTYNFNGLRLLGIMAAQKHIDGCGWPALTTFQKSLIKMAHEMACDRPPCIDLVLTNSFLQTFFFFCLALTKASCWIRLLRLHFSMSCYTWIYWLLVPYFFFAAQNDLISCCTVHGGICSSCAPLKLPY